MAKGNRVFRAWQPIKDDNISSCTMVVTLSGKFPLFSFLTATFKALLCYLLTKFEKKVERVKKTLKILAAGAYIEHENAALPMFTNSNALPFFPNFVSRYRAHLFHFN